MDPSRYMERTLRDRGDYGLKIARKGYDLRFAADNQLLYNSAFPVLQIVEFITDDTDWEVVSTGSYTFWSEYSGVTSTRWKHSMRRLHGLGHPPMIAPLSASGWTSGDKNISWDLKYIYYEKTFITETEYNAFISSDAPTGTFVVFNIDIDTDVEYPYVDDGMDTEWGQKYDYGIKHLLTDDVNSMDPADLGLNANVQSMLVVAVKVATIEDKNRNIYLPEGIDPEKLSPFSYIKQTNGRWIMGGVSIQAVSGYRPAVPAAGINYYTLDGQYFAPKCSLVLVRLPMLSSDKTNASFNM